MYYSYYRLSKNPFGGPADPRHICMTETHREALSTLVYGILERKPFVAVIGEVGVGKTTVLQAALLAVADQHARIIQILQPVVPPDVLIRTISEKLTVPPDPPLQGPDLERLDQLLVEEAEISGRVVIVVDEAQGLPDDSLEHLRLLSNLRAGQNGLLEIIFVGQPEFWTALQREDLRHLRQRISVRSIIRPLSEADARSYIEYELRLAGSSTAEIMTDGALQAILRYGRGVPRRINIIADNALVTGYGLSIRPITAEIVKEAAASMEAPVPGQDGIRLRLPVIRLPRSYKPALNLLQSKLQLATPRRLDQLPRISPRLGMVLAAAGGAAAMGLLVWAFGGSPAPRQVAAAGAEETQGSQMQASPMQASPMAAHQPETAAVVPAAPPPAGMNKGAAPAGASNPPPRLAAGRSLQPEAAVQPQNPQPVTAARRVALSGPMSKQTSAVVAPLPALATAGPKGTGLAPPAKSVQTRTAAHPALQAQPAQAQSAQAQSAPRPMMAAPGAAPTPAPAAAQTVGDNVVAASEAHNVPLIRLPGIRQIEYRTAPNDKAEVLMQRYYGRADEDAMNLFMMLNPLLTDSEDIPPGTWIHLPVKGGVLTASGGSDGGAAGELNAAAD